MLYKIINNSTVLLLPRHFITSRELINERKKKGFTFSLIAERSRKTIILFQADRASCELAF